MGNEETIRERLARGEQNMLNHLIESERRLTALEKKATENDTRINGIDARLNKYGWAARVTWGIMLVVGGIFGWMIDRWHIVQDWLHK